MATIQEFIRALKASSDPPVAGGRTKIEIARHAWDDNAFFLPSKAQVIADWLLSTFLKDKSKSASTSSIFDSSHWKLLLDVLTDQGLPVPLSTWLPPLLYRISLLPILSAFMAKFGEAGSPMELSTVVCSCANKLWALAEHKMLLEDLTDIFSSVLQRAEQGHLTPGIITIGILVTSSYRTSLGNVTNKKKFYNLFLQSVFPCWLRVLSQSLPLSSNFPPEEGKVGSLYEDIYNAGRDTLFNLDTLRQLCEDRPTDQSTALFNCLQKACSSSSEFQAVLSIMPKIFLSFVQAVKRHRGTVFSQTSKAIGAGLNDEVNTASMRFLVNCEVVIASVGESGEMRTEVWDARLRLLESVFEEKLFNTQQDAFEALGTIVLDIIGVLEHSWKVGYGDVVSSAVKCLYKIGQIDCDLLLPSLPRILPLILPISSKDLTTASFLDLILDYHTKTRTLNDHIHNLLASFSSTSFPSEDSADMHEVYVQCFSSHVVSNRSLERLGRAIRTFLTPGQTLRCVEMIFETINDSWKAFSNSLKGIGDLKENAMAVDSGFESQAQDVKALAVSLSLQVYLILFVLTNLPMQHLTEESAMSVRCLVSNFREQTVRKALLKILRVKRLLPGKGKKRRESVVARDGWETQIVATAMLRVEYVLNVAKITTQDSMMKVIEQAKGVINTTGGSGELIAELELEIFRTLLHYLSLNDIQQGPPSRDLDIVLSYLNSAFKPSGTTWSGLPCHLKGPESGALAVLHLILERWLSLLDQLATSSQLTNIIQLILGIDLESIANAPNIVDPELRPEYLLFRLLHSAEFWEMQNLRSAMLSYLVEAASTTTAQIQESELAVYRLLLYVPTEYFTKNARTRLVKRAREVDFQLVKGFVEGEKGTEHSLDQQRSALRNLITLRVFLGRVIGLVGFERISDADLGGFIVHLMTFDCEIEGLEYDAFVQSTLDLTVTCFSEILRNANSYSDSLFRVLSSFNQSTILVGRNHGIQPRLQSQTIYSLVTEILKLKDSASLPSECISSLRTFHDRLSATISRYVKHVNSSNLTHYLESLTGWCCVLNLRRWLGENHPEDDACIGKHLISVAIRSCQVADDCKISISAILQAEMFLLTEERSRRRQLDLIVAAFVVFHGSSSDAARRELSVHISAISKLLGADDYSYTLDLVLESLSPSSLPVDKLAIVVHLANLLLKSNPQYTLGHMQSFSTQCLNTFSDNSTFMCNSAALRLSILEFVAQHCSERPAILRSIDIGSIFIVLFSFLRPSEEHDERTAPEVFHKIIASISALVRLRRDLVVSVLPHLGLALNKLISLIRSCRPQLGSKQTDMVMRNFPRWVAIGQPLGLEEGRMLSRLLETLNVKTVVRSHVASKAQKAESLAKPFSKHAAYVLAAYIEALNDPLCVIGLEMRREFEPGLFALCEIMGEHARDALYVSLDNDDKAVLKMIWKEYGKQRYVGRG